MASTYKTAKLKLNQWLGEDRPKRADFNADNEAIDTAVAGHVEDEEVHLSKGMKAGLLALLASGGQGISMGSYTGDGTTPRFFSLGFTPRIVVVYADQQVPSVYAPDPGYNASHMAIATALGGSMGLALTDDGFRVTNSLQVLPYGRLSRMNEAGVDYVYIVL